MNKQEQNINIYIQLAKILLVLHNAKKILVPQQNFRFSNIDFFSIAPHSVIALPTLQ